MKIRILLAAASLLLEAVLPPTLIAGPGDPPPPIPEFEAGHFGPDSFIIDHPYFPLRPGDKKVLQGETEDGLERVVITVEEETRMVFGIECRVVLDRAYEDDELVEETYDWFAQDLMGNVWYFGEESFEIEDGEIVSSEGSWEAGVDGALPGYQMLASPMVGDTYRQEHDEGEAEDMAEVTATDVSVTLTDGTKHPSALKTLEWTPLEPEALENKYYVAGMGLVREEQADGSEPIDLVSSDLLPLKEAKLNIEHNATDDDTGFQGFIDGESWQSLSVTFQEGESLLSIEGLGEWISLGFTELFFETVEPENAEVSIADMLLKLPEGVYAIAGPILEDGEQSGSTSGSALLTHDIPEGPELRAPAEEMEVESSEALEFRWEPVTEDLEGEAVSIIAYQLIIEKVGAPHPHMMTKPGMSMYLPGHVTSVTLPGGVLEPDTQYEWEVLAIEESGNQTLSSSEFSTGDAPDVMEPDAEDPPHLKAAKLIIEHNATDEDTGFQGFVDSEGWQSLAITGPGEETVFRVEGHGTLGQLGLTELFFETVEPENNDVSIEDMLAKLPAGDYSIAGVSMQNGEGGDRTSGTAWLTHVIPAGPELLEPAEDAEVPSEGLTVRWNPVTETIQGEPLNLIAYQVIVQEDRTPHPNQIGNQGLDMVVSPSVTSVRIPDAILRPGAEYEWEVLAIEESGNQTLSSGAFVTEPAATELPDFSTAVFSRPTDIDNPYFPLVPGMSYTFLGETEDDGEFEIERVVIDVLEETRLVAGIEARIVRDRVFVDDLLIEDTFDWYAQDDEGNVWYLGEEVTDFEYDDEGNLVGTSHPGEWEAGVDGALPGHIMKAEPMAGQIYYQEYLVGEAVDEGTVLSVGESVTTSAGAFEGVIRILDSSTLFGDFGHKFYAPGIGLVLEVDYDEDGNEAGRSELISIGDPKLPGTDLAIGIDIDGDTGRVVISVDTVIGWVYDLEASSDLEIFVPVSEGVQGTGERIEFEDMDDRTAGRFFRIRQRAEE